MKNGKQKSKAMTKPATIPTIGDSETKIDIYELRKRIEPIIRDPHSLIHFPNYRDYDRELKYSLSSIGQWLLRTPTRVRLFTEHDRSFIFCKHTTFDNVADLDPQSQRQRIATSYRLSRISRRFPHFYSLAYHTEYGKSSYWTVSHLKDIITNKLFAHGIAMSVMIDSRTRRPQPVIPGIKAICDNNWINEYPKEFKEGQYPKLKHDCSEHIGILNALRDDQTKELLYSYPIQMRYLDEDQNKHLNTNTYSRYSYECLMMYDDEIRKNEAAIFWMTNLFWKEIRMQHYSHCYANLWSIKKDGTTDKIYIGTIDIDESRCKRNVNKTDEITMSNRNDLSDIKWRHHHGFMARVVRIKRIESKL